MSILYTCYSLPLRDYLMERGFRYELVACNKNTMRSFWVFIRTPELNMAIDSYYDKFK